jgi:hypothetical protein
MSFFDKKEEVLEFKLTEYGKRKLQLGRLNPTFYAFFDDDVLYNTEEYASTRLLLKSRRARPEQRRELTNFWKMPLVHYKRLVVWDSTLFLKTLLHL